MVSLTLSTASGDPVPFVIQKYSPQPLVSGIVQFADLNIQTAGSFALQASIIVRDAVNNIDMTFTTRSNVFVIVPSQLSQLRFITNPGGGPTDVPWFQQPVVELLDRYGNRRTQDDSSMANITVNKQSRSLLRGNTSIPVRGGLGQATDLFIPIVGSYVLQASVAIPVQGSTRTPVITALSGTFTVTLSAATYMSTTQLAAEISINLPFPRQPIFVLYDRMGNVDTRESSRYCFLKLVPVVPPVNSGVILGRLNVSMVQGVCSFANLKINAVGSYNILCELKFPSPTASVDFSTSTPTFNIFPPKANKLVINNVTASAEATQLFDTQPSVEVLDEAGDLLTIDSSSFVYLLLKDERPPYKPNERDIIGRPLSHANAFLYDINKDPETGVNTLQSQLTPLGNFVGNISGRITAGMVQFQNLTMNKVGNFSIVARLGTTVVEAVSSLILITVGPPVELSILQQPGGGEMNAVWSLESTPVIQLVDRGGNLFGADSNSFIIASLYDFSPFVFVLGDTYFQDGTIELASRQSDSRVGDRRPPALTGVLRVNLDQGVSVFKSLVINQPGPNYRLLFSQQSLGE